ncbi:MAG: AAA family ATPase [Proteobacteria bacterium]|nr:AAA family ATPase [Pseudomonadota bacterium]
MTHSQAAPVAPPDLSFEAAQRVVQRLSERLRTAVIGRDEVIELVLVALLADGHVLLEDYPGSGKTTLARALGDSLSDTTTDAIDATDAIGAIDAPIVPFRRIQFTPDLLPSDVTGATVFEPDSSTFTFRRGPIFAHIVLADEINRTSPKVQAAMLEAMAEKQVTVDNHTYKLDELFFVVATQNPLDVAGTYPLPVPQLDRFLFKIEMTHLERTAELRVLDNYPKTSLELAAERPRVSRQELLTARALIRQHVALTQPVREALVDLARALRDDPRVLQGASTRSLVLLMPALQARAFVNGRDYVAPEDLEHLAPRVFAHRMECVPGVDDKAEVVRSNAGPVMETLARLSLRRRPATPAAPAPSLEDDRNP